MCRIVFGSLPPLTATLSVKARFFESKATRRLGCTPVSATQTRSRSSTAIAYGNDRSRLGIANSATFPLAGSSRPR